MAEETGSVYYATVKIWRIHVRNSSLPLSGSTGGIQSLLDTNPLGALHGRNARALRMTRTCPPQSAFAAASAQLHARGPDGDGPADARRPMSWTENRRRSDLRKQSAISGQRSAGRQLEAEC